MQVSRKTFDSLLENAIAGLPPQFARWLDEVPIIVEDRPADKTDDEPLGLYMGSSLPDPPTSGELPPRIMIYRQPLMDACTTREQLAEEIRKTLLHELGHHAGMEEDELNSRGYGPLDSGDDIEFDLDDDQ